MISFEWKLIGHGAYTKGDYSNIKYNFNWILFGGKYRCQSACLAYHH
jgi:hypothetical protein